MFRDEQELLDKVLIFKDTSLLKPKYLCTFINVQPNTSMRTLWVFPFSESCAIHLVPESVISRLVARFMWEGSLRPEELQKELM